jgi:Caspase domain
MLRYVRLFIELPLFAFFGLSLCLEISHAETRIALVVGNSNYRYVAPLTNPANDAKLIAGTLAKLGFKLIGNGPQLDLNKNQFDQAVQDFGNAIQGADVALFYYAGHGVQVRGANYLVPVSANPTREVDVDFQMLDVNLVLREMEYGRARLNLVILDACRNNPFGGRGLRSVSAGLAQMQAPEGTLISFATQPGNVAQDGADGDSPFSKALADTLTKPGLDIFRVFNQVGLVVSRATGGEQQPWVSLSPIKGDFYFSNTPKANVRNDVADLGQNESHPPSATLNSTDLVHLMKLHLRQAGCYAGEDNGVWDKDARRALEQFNEHAGTRLNVNLPSMDALTVIRAKKGRICPLVCRKGTHPQGDHCVALKQKPKTKPSSAKSEHVPKAQGASRNDSAANLLNRCRSRDRGACETLCSAGFYRLCHKANRMH